MEFGFEFWKRVDELRGIHTIAELANAMDMKEQSVKNLRSENRYPKKLAIEALARYLNTTSDYLMTGKAPELKPSSCDDATAERREIEEALNSNPALEKYVLRYIETMKDLVQKE